MRRMVVKSPAADGRWRKTNAVVRTKPQVMLALVTRLGDSGSRLRELYYVHMWQDLRGSQSPFSLDGLIRQ